MIKMDWKTARKLEALVSLRGIHSGLLDHTGGQGHAGSPAAQEEVTPEDVGTQ